MVFAIVQLSPGIQSLQGYDAAACMIALAQSESQHSEQRHLGRAIELLDQC